MIATSAITANDKSSVSGGGVLFGESAAVLRMGASAVLSKPKVDINKHDFLSHQKHPTTLLH